MSGSFTYGTITHDSDARRPTDYLYRVSLKALIRNDRNEVLVVKEVGRSYWDLPGGGMDHGETIKTALARELKEEISLVGDFTYKVIAAEDPKYLTEHNFWQIRLIVVLDTPQKSFSAGIDSDEAKFIDVALLKTSKHAAERRISHYF